jgi:hypothetical protein
MPAGRAGGPRVRISAPCSDGLGQCTAGYLLLQKQTLLKDQLEVVRLKQPDGTTRYSIKPLETEFSFDKGFFMFIRAIQLLTQHNKDTILVRALTRR